jgi:hypothetical protein
LTQTEHDLQTKILNYLNVLPGIFCWRNQSQGTFDPTTKVFRKKSGYDIKGVSDIIGIISPSGHFFAVEVKSKTGRLSMEQRAFLKKIRHLGGFSCVTNDFDQFLNYWNGVEKCPL